MAQTTRDIRFVFGTQAQYEANRGKYADDIYFATDTPSIYVMGRAYPDDIQRLEVTQITGFASYSSSQLQGLETGLYYDPDQPAYYVLYLNQYGQKARSADLAAYGGLETGRLYLPSTAPDRIHRLTSAGGLEEMAYRGDIKAYSAATQGAAGLMSAADKKKLDGIATGANKTTVDSALSSTSTNPVQNKAVKAALDALQYHTLRIPYSLYSLATTATMADSHFASTQWGTRAAFLEWVREFAKHGGSVVMEMTDPEASSTNTRVQSCKWRFLENTATVRLMVEYSSNFPTSATNAKYDSGITFQYAKSTGNYTWNKREL